MNLDRTIFILGAGASVPYGYPTAYALRQSIIHQKFIVLSWAYKYFSFKNQIDKNGWIKQFDPFINQFDKSNTESVDLFLTRNKGVIDIELGIQLLLYNLIWFEMQSKTLAFDKDWYFAFYNELTREVTNKDQLLGLVNHPILFITFNYDRSLENFLFNSLMNSFSLDQLETVEVYNKLFTVYHVYGSICSLKWQNDNSFNYGDESMCANVPRLKNNIRLIYDDREKISDYIQSLILASKNIYILGFGFAKANLEKLNLKNLLSNEHNVFASGLNLYDSQVSQTIQLLKRGQGGIQTHQINIEQNMNSLKLLESRLF